VSAPETSSKIFLVMHPDLRRAPRVRAFCDFVIAEIDAFSRCGAAGLTPRRGERDALAVMLSGGEGNSARRLRRCVPRRRPTCEIYGCESHKVCITPLDRVAAVLRAVVDP
jgi:hypothetical protein